MTKSQKSRPSRKTKKGGAKAPQLSPKVIAAVRNRISAAAEDYLMHATQLGQASKPPGTHLSVNGIRSRLENVQDRLSNFATRLAAVGDRIEGPTPMPVGADAAANRALSASVVPINNQLNSVDNLIEYINNEVIRLENAL